MSWDAVEEAVLTLRPPDGIVIATADSGAFKWFLEVIPAQSILSRLRETVGLQVKFLDAGRSGFWTLASILSAPRQYGVDGAVVTLSASQLFELFVLCKSKEEGFALLRRVLADSSAVCESGRTENRVE